MLKASSASSNQGMSVKQQPKPPQMAEKPLTEASAHQPLEHLIAGILRRGLRLEKAVAHTTQIEPGSDGLRLVLMLLPPILPKPACATQVILLEHRSEKMASASGIIRDYDTKHHLEVNAAAQEHMPVLSHGNGCRRWNARLSCGAWRRSTSE